MLKKAGFIFNTRFYFKNTLRRYFVSDNLLLILFYKVFTYDQRNG